MKAIVYDAPREFVYRDIPVPEIQANEILLRVHACGVCGTDLHVHEGEFGPRFPLTPGHEFSGEIVELGSGVTGERLRWTKSSPTKFPYGIIKKHWIWPSHEKESKLLSSHDVAKHMNHHWMRVECHYSNFTFMRRDPNLLTPKYEKLDK